MTEGLRRFPRATHTPLGNPNPVGGCTTDPFCQIWGHVVVHRLDGGKVRMTHIELKDEPTAADGSD